MELQELRGWFSQVDRDRSGTITAREVNFLFNLFFWLEIIYLSI